MTLVIPIPAPPVRKLRTMAKELPSQRGFRGGAAPAGSGMPWLPGSIAACAFALGDSADEILIFPAGDFGGSRGALMGQGPWRLDARSAEALIATTRRYFGSQAAVVDYNHQTLIAAGSGGEAPAAGWIDPVTLVWREGAGIAATVKWTAEARAAIAADQYRYLSPVFSYDAKTAVPLCILSVALTNTPALGISRLNSREWIETSTRQGRPPTTRVSPGSIAGSGLRLRIAAQPLPQQGYFPA
ncbi:phage protease [Methylococcus sp. ANG]|uniref:phage protease n=1 Tax=Methylococcus sp. ANG TaxID=3231903 RepID=UPI003459C341